MFDPGVFFTVMYECNVKTGNKFYFHTLPICRWRFDKNCVAYEHGAGWTTSGFLPQSQWRSFSKDPTTSDLVLVSPLLFRLWRYPFLYLMDFFQFLGFSMTWRRSFILSGSPLALWDGVFCYIWKGGGSFRFGWNLGVLASLPSYPNSMPGCIGIIRVFEHWMCNKIYLFLAQYIDNNVFWKISIIFTPKFDRCDRVCN